MKVKQKKSFWSKIMIIKIILATIVIGWIISNNNMRAFLATVARVRMGGNVLDVSIPKLNNIYSPCNEISWSPGKDVPHVSYRTDEHYLEASVDRDFNVISENSGWISDINNYKLQEPPVGTPYYYRVKGRGSTKKAKNSKWSTTATCTKISDEVSGRVSNIVGVDNDTVVYDLSGKDFSVTWSPKGKLPTGYIDTNIFIVPANNKVINPVNAKINGCGGKACKEVGFFTNYFQSSYNLPHVIKRDSEGILWSEDTIYKACILIRSNIPSLDCSEPFYATSEKGIQDNDPPFIRHNSAYSFISGNELVVYFFVSDNQTTDSDFANNIQNASVEMIHDGINMGSVTSKGQVTKVIGVPKLWRAETNIPLSRDIKYYLRATDKVGNIKYFTANPEVDMDINSTNIDAAEAAFNVKAVNAGRYTISGQIKDASTKSVIPHGSIVVLNGLGTPGVRAENGLYSFYNVPTGSYNIIAASDGYCEQTRFVTISSDRTGVNLFLNKNNCESTSNADKPVFRFSSPPKNTNTAPLDKPILIGFSEPLNPSEVNDTDTTGSTDAIYMTTDDGTTKIPGSSIYCPDKTSPGCSELNQGDTNVIMFMPSNDLTPNTSYTLVITEGITSENGYSIDGNRPEGGYALNFNTIQATLTQEEIQDNFGSGGQFTPPFIESIVPAPGISAKPNTKIALTFNEPMKSSTINTNNILLYREGRTKKINVSLDASEKIVTITPVSLLTSGQYEVHVLEYVANNLGIPMTNGQGESDIAFRSSFNVTGEIDTKAPDIYPIIPNGSINIPVNIGLIGFGFSEPMDPSAINTSNISFNRGSSSVAINLNYNVGQNELSVMPTNILIPSTKYTVSFTKDVKDLADNSITAQSFSFTTGSADITPPALQKARCDNYTCKIYFTEPVMSDTQTGENWENSVLNNFNLTIEKIKPSHTVIPINKPIIYKNSEFAIKTEGLVGLSPGDSFRITAGTKIKDLSGNSMEDSSMIIGTVEDNIKTFGNFDDTSMFNPTGGESDLSESSGFGKFTAEEFAFGGAIEASPINNTAGQDSNIFHIKIPMSTIGKIPKDGDRIIFTFPKGTNITNAKKDEFSPYTKDFNNSAPGIITFDNAYSNDGIDINFLARTVTIQLKVTGAPTITDLLKIDLKGIINPNIPKDPRTSGYTLGVNWERDGLTGTNITSTPYYISKSGNNSITIKVYAGTAGTGLTGANGDIFMFAGGPAGPMNKNLTLTNGITTAVDGTSVAGDSGIIYNYLMDGCYNFGTEPLATLGGKDYFGQPKPEPICVKEGENKSKNIVLIPVIKPGSPTIPITVKIDHKGGGFNNSNIDIFAGSPKILMVKTIKNVNNPASSGYTINLPENGAWKIGIGPSMPKGSTTALPDFESFGGTPPSPIDIEAKGLPGIGSAKLRSNTPAGVSFNSETNTITFTIKSNNIQIPVHITDGTNGLSNVNVYMHQQGFGKGAFGHTDANGNVTLKVANYGPYEIGAFMSGLGKTHKQIDIRNNGGTKIYTNGTLVDVINLQLEKKDYTISGKVLDSDNQPIAYASIIAKNTNGKFVPNKTNADGSYTLFVEEGVWDLSVELPPAETSVCGTFAKTITITDASKYNQHITPTGSTCNTISGTVTIDGNLQANMLVSIKGWNVSTDRPTGNFRRNINTDSNGSYNAKLPNGTYRISTFDTVFGEIGDVVTVSNSDITKNLDSGTLSDITFLFNEGQSNMNGFIEVKKANDRHTRLSKSFSGANENMTLRVKSGTYNYMVDIKGVGSFKGSVNAGSNVNIDLTEYSLVNLSGTIYDTNNNALPNTSVSLHDFENGINEYTQTDESGNYFFKIKSGNYTIKVKRAGYTAPDASITLNKDLSGYDFGGNDNPENSGLIKAQQIISGTIYKADGSTPETDARVWAENSNGKIVSTPSNSVDGSYTLTVIKDDTWVISAVAPMHDETSLDGTIDTTDEIADTGKNITLIENITKIPKAKNSSIDIATGATIDDTGNTGMKIVAPNGALDTAQGTASITMEKSFKAPETDTFKPLGQTSYDLDITNSAGQAIKSFPKNIEVTFEYNPDDLPSGAKEGDLSVMYFSNEANTYRKCEGGVIIDEVNNVATCSVSHATTFAIVFPKEITETEPVDEPDEDPTPIPTIPPAILPTIPSSNSNSGGGGGGGSAGIINISPTEDVKENNLKKVATKEIIGIFKDTKNHWAKDYIQFIVENKIADGYSKDYFGPDDSLTRAQAIKMLLNYNRIEVDTSVQIAKKPFLDVSTNDWFAPYVQKAKELDIVHGYGDGLFRPNRAINRAEAMKIFYRNSYGYKPKTYKYASRLLSEFNWKKSPFIDVPPYTWYAPYVFKSYQSKTVEGYSDGRFHPDRQITRAEFSKILAKEKTLLAKKELQNLNQKYNETKNTVKKLIFTK